MLPVVIPRWASRIVRQGLASHRVVSVVGARQSGKTTLLRAENFPQGAFVSLDQQQVLSDVKTDCAFFLRRYARAYPLIVDEIQKAPELVGEIKYVVDRNPSKGQFIITGSADYRKLPHANESLAGRVACARVRTFAEAEARQCEPFFLRGLFDGLLPLDAEFGDFCKAQFCELLLKGGYPELMDVGDPQQRTLWFDSYVKQQIILDMRNQWGVRKSDVLERLIALAVAFSSKLLVKRTLLNVLGTSAETFESYLSALQAMFLVDLLPGWKESDYDRPSQTSKLFLTDSGLMANRMGIFHPKDILENREVAANEGGKLAETWVYNQLVAELELNPLWRMWHLRTKTHEIDFLLFNEKKECLGIEVKFSESVSPDDFRHLRWFGNLYRPQKFTGVVLYAGNRVVPGGDNCYAIPMPAFWTPEKYWR